MMTAPQEAAPQVSAQPPQAAPQAGQLDQSALHRVVLAGQRLMYDQKTREYFVNGLKKEGDPTDILAAEVIGLIKMLDEKAKGNLPKQVIAPAAIALLIEVSHFAAQAGYFVMTKQAIAVAAKKIIDALMQQYGTVDAAKAPAGAQPEAPAPTPAAPGGLIQQAQGV